MLYNAKECSRIVSKGGCPAEKRWGRIDVKSPRLPTEILPVRIRPHIPHSSLQRSDPFRICPHIRSSSGNKILPIPVFVGDWRQHEPVIFQEFLVKARSAVEIRTRKDDQLL